MPAGGPVDGYALYKLAFDGSPITFEALGAGATSSVQDMDATHYCYTLVAFRGAAFGNTNLVCGIQGFSTLGAIAGGLNAAGGQALAQTGVISGAETVAVPGCQRQLRELALPAARK